jgi:catechol 2,3-dioxygenase-like lactoylglutathione lyase family enzyme
VKPALHCLLFLPLCGGVVLFAAGAGGAAADGSAGAALRLKNAAGADALRAGVGQVISLELNIPGESWATANIGHLGIRAGAEQHNLPAAAYERSGGPQWTFKEPGHALVLLAAGPAAAKGTANAWRQTTRCTKLVLTIDPADGSVPGGDGAGLTARVGQRIEIVPVVPPPQLRPGGELPVRAYFDDSTAGGAELRALGPDGAEQILTASPSGLAVVRITGAGRWLVSFDKNAGGTAYRAELVFEVR